MKNLNLQLSWALAGLHKGQRRNRQLHSKWTEEADSPIDAISHHAILWKCLQDYCD